MTLTSKTTGVVHASRGVVASSQQLASEVGAELLREGGSAVDAAIGTNAMLSLIEPYMCGPGGDLFAQVWSPGDRSLSGINASGHAPINQALGELQARLDGAEEIPPNGVHAITTPGAARGWAALHERFGRLPLAKIFAPVIDYGRRGVKVGAATSIWWQHAAAAVIDDPSIESLKPAFRRTFLFNDAPPSPGQTIRNPDLADTYQAIVDGGFDDVYSGRIGAHARQS